MALADEDRQHAEELLAQYRKRLRVRERQISRLGDSADPSIEVDADELRGKITVLEAVLKPDLPDDLAFLVKRRIEDDVFLFQQSVEQNARITKVEDRVATMEAGQHSAALWRLDKGSVIDALQERAVREDRDAPKGRRFTRRLMLINFVLLLCMFGAIVWLAVGK